MNNQLQYPQEPSFSRPTRSLLVRAIDLISIILAIVSSLFLSPFLIKYTQNFFIGFMNLTWGDSGGLYEFVWWVICHLFVGASALVIIHTKLTSKITRLALKGFK